MRRGRVAGLRQPARHLDQPLINYIALSRFSGDSWRLLPGASNNRQAKATRGEAAFVDLLRRLRSVPTSLVPSPRDPARGEVRRHAPRPVR